MNWYIEVVYRTWEVDHGEGRGQLLRGASGRALGLGQLGAKQRQLGARQLPLRA